MHIGRRFKKISISTQTIRAAILQILLLANAMTAMAQSEHPGSEQIASMIARGQIAEAYQDILIAKNNVTSTKELSELSALEAFVADQLQLGVRAAKIRERAVTARVLLDTENHTLRFLDLLALKELAWQASQDRNRLPEFSAVLKKFSVAAPKSLDAMVTYYQVVERALIGGPAEGLSALSEASSQPVETSDLLRFVLLRYQFEMQRCERSGIEPQQCRLPELIPIFKAHLDITNAPTTPNGPASWDFLTLATTFFEAHGERALSRAAAESLRSQWDSGAPVAAYVVQRITAARWLMSRAQFVDLAEGVLASVLDEMPLRGPVDPREIRDIFEFWRDAPGNATLRLIVLERALLSDDPFYPNGHGARPRFLRHLLGLYERIGNEPGRAAVMEAIMALGLPPRAKQALDDAKALSGMEAVDHLSDAYLDANEDRDFVGAQEIANQWLKASLELAPFDELYGPEEKLDWDVAMDVAGLGYLAYPGFRSSGPVSEVHVALVSLSEAYIAIGDTEALDIILDELKNEIDLLENTSDVRVLDFLDIVKDAYEQFAPLTSNAFDTEIVTRENNIRVAAAWFVLEEPRWSNDQFDALAFELFETATEELKGDDLKAFLIRAQARVVEELPVRRLSINSSASS